MNARKRLRGFSLSMVLVVMLVGTALIWVAFSLFESFTFRSISMVDTMDEMNIMDGGIELGRIELARMLQDQSTGMWMPRAIFKETNPITEIRSPDHLLIVASPGATEPWGIEIDRKDAFGEKITVKVEIFDINYDATQLASDMTDAVRAQMPPAMSVAATASGIVTAGDSGGVGSVSNEDAYATLEDTAGMAEEIKVADVGTYLIRATIIRKDGSRAFTELALARTK